MQVVDKVKDQVLSVGLPMVAVSLTAVPRANTPVLLMVHWHGFARRQEPQTGASAADRHERVGIPSTAIQLSEVWLEIEQLDEAMLEAAWELGAWDLLREEHRGCNTVGASEQEALACRQAFAEHPFDGPAEEFALVEAPDRADLMQLGARVGYVRWQFRPVKNGLWAEMTGDDTLMPDGGRPLPCPVQARPAIGPRQCRTRYPLGRSSRIFLI